MKNTFDHGGTVFAVARYLGVPPEEILDFSASINPLGPVPGVREALAAAFDRLVHYPDSDAAELRDALARRHGLAPECFCVANGSTELIYLVPSLAAAGRGLIVAPPFSEYAKSLARGGREVDYLDLSPADGFTLSPSSLNERLGAGGHSLLFLCNPGNPTGRLIPRAGVAEVLDICHRRGTFLVLDEAFIDFCEEESAVALAAEREGVVVLRSMTKFFAIPGVRLGSAVGHPRTIARLAPLREPWSVNTLAQVAGIASLADPSYPRRTRDLVAAERERLAAGLTRLPGLSPFPSTANYILVEITAGPDAPALCRRLREERILVRDCSTFRGLDGRFFRVAVRGGEENDLLLAALGRALAG
ncbi:threonine-phosphate decarboxylase CobD [Geobacter sp.]|uniref:threonine-phosphate decarboxylase CobD n=1 Tax=Geobacter sp. TaxID=46610 RepID=UPI002634A888|nr:threonine-phosphate decarboxylase CobD [Geobacter sp.]